MEGSEKCFKTNAGLQQTKGREHFNEVDLMEALIEYIELQQKINGNQDFRLNLLFFMVFGLLVVLGIHFYGVHG